MSLCMLEASSVMNAAIFGGKWLSACSLYTIVHYAFSFVVWIHFLFIHIYCRSFFVRSILQFYVVPRNWNGLSICLYFGIFSLVTFFSNGTCWLNLQRENLLVYFLVFFGICSGKRGKNFEKLKNAVATINLFVLSRS